MLAELLATPGVEEVSELRSTVGFMAFHGGGLEQVTDVVAREAAERSDASYYAVLHPEDLDVHVASHHFDPAKSAQLRAFLQHVDHAIAIHGYGREAMPWSLLLGGRNRDLATHLAAHLRPHLPAYDIVDDIDAIPGGLAGLHPDNPVNRTAGRGVQIELPPLVRWNWPEWGWSDHGAVGRAPQTEQLIRGLARAVQAWVPD